MKGKPPTAPIADALTTMFNAALDLIRNGDFEQARQIYEQAAVASAILSYWDGVAMSSFSIANLALLQRNYVAAIKYGASAYEEYTQESDKADAKAFCIRAALQLVQEGVEHERAGRISQALERFELALPYLEGKRAQAVRYETKLLKGMSGNERS